ncbi:dephospho-CoA kinase [Schaalia hyovaginalis]|uniref:dephospho-CoA kinase n=1 Tax=Schaalia TaxID=2529408 RepID=UPI0026EBDF40|nr:dephospho-CoA kinase [Schaalia hyovaginalis]MCI7513098.1 dephospho-CoA kinase [Schaalia hyovaginalis]MDY3094644.1 dephospho-CoA kinase [Schaalia hyovaginalis]MDY3665749.1 dephospho-CoA kinase [Schaalia hyovaginalis]MDY4492801.1 dephospho-CoA kinase [Schaalia hyovaginalis]MDY5600566.1 dephospho-CoA kinase [Schaalia hyovaginalis]
MSPHDLDSAPRSLEEGGARARLLRPFDRPRARALRIGLTGGIGSGKSTVSSALEGIGATVADADRIAREVVERGSEGLQRLIDRFGEDILLASGGLDRAALAAIIFADRDAREEVEAILHPLIADRAAAILARAPEDGLAVYDVPLLVEAGLAGRFDAILVVEAPVELRLERLEVRGTPRDEALSRMSAQSSDDDRRALAHILVENSGTREDAIGLVEAIDRSWLRPARPLAGERARKRLR